MSGYRQRCAIAGCTADAIGCVRDDRARPVPGAIFCDLHAADVVAQLAEPAGIGWSLAVLPPD